MFSTGNGSKSPLGGIWQRLPKLSTTVWLIIIGALVLVAVVPMLSSYMDETARQAPMKDRLATLKAQYVNLQKQLSSQSSLTAEINALKAEADASRALYGDACDSIETSRDLIDLAWQYDITIVNMTVSSPLIKIQGKEYEGTSYTLNMSGQVANFQNYLIAVGNKFVSSRIADVIIQPALEEGALDHAILTIMMVCAQ